MGGYYDYKPYVPVAKRRAQAAKEVARRLKKGQKVTPVLIEGRTIAATFWGRAWCENLESYSDFENRLPRGRTYVRNGSVVHLTIDKGRIEALVSGSEVYTVRIDIDALPKPHWQALKRESAGKMGTLVELLQGKLSKAMMELVTGRAHGLFPKPKEIKMRCSCPDGASMCKHLAAVMYGVGNRLDSMPEFLFVLRGVDHLELIEQAIPSAPLKTRHTGPTIATDDLGALFGIEIGDAPVAAKPAAKSSPTKARALKKVSAVKSEKKASATKSVKKASATKSVKKASATKTRPVSKKG